MAKLLQLFGGITVFGRGILINLGVIIAFRFILILASSVGLSVRVDANACLWETPLQHPEATWSVFELSGN